MQASEPPAAITSKYPSRMAWKASPMELVPDAQAVTQQVQLPLNPKRMATEPAAMFTMAIGTKSGEIRSKPRF